MLAGNKPNQGQAFISHYKPPCVIYWGACWWATKRPKSQKSKEEKSK